MKKHSISLYFLILSIFCITHLQAQQINLKEGLIAHYPFNENAKDVAGTNHGKANHVQIQASRCGDNAYYFNGGDAYIDFGNSKNLNMNFSALAISVWIMPEFTNNNELGTIVGKWGFNERRDQFGLWINPSNKIVFAVSAPGTMEEGIFSQSVIPVQEWHHVVAIWHISGEMRIYIDGKLDQVGHQTGRGINTRSDLSLKAGRQIVRKNRAYKGYMDELRLYDRILSEEEILALYNEGMLACEKVTIAGTVINKKTKEPTPANIIVEDMNTGTIFKKFKSNADATYEFILPFGGKYAFFAERENFLSENRNISTENMENNTMMTRDLYLVPVEAGEKLTLNNIFFDFNKSTLKQESYAELNRILPFFKRYPTAKIELAGHTDSVGSDAYNQDLSEDRADAVRQYLIRKGVDPSKIVSKGYGEQEPVATNDTDEGRQENRRVEFRILSK